MNDQQLSEQLRRSQRIRRICLPVMGFCFPGGLVAGVWFRNLPAYLVLTFGGAGGAFWLRHHIRKRNRKLIDEHLKDFYKEELERVFGSKRHTPELAITKEVVQANGFMEGEWEECRVENEYEGVYRGHPFSAANISLYHVYRRKVDQGYSIERKEVFQGIWLIGRMAHQDRCLAVETKVKFAEVPDEDISDMTKLRQGFLKSLAYVEQLLDEMLEGMIE